MNLVKSNIALLVVAVALAVPTGVQLWSEAESFVDYSRIPLMFDGFTEENVGTIQLGRPKAPEDQPKPNPQKPDQKMPVAYDQLILQRGDQGWVVGQAMGAPNALAGAPVSTQMIETLVFDHLRKIRVDREKLIQANATPEQLEEYGLDELSADLIRVTDKTNANVVAQLYVGNQASENLRGPEGVSGVFVRKHGSNDVVLYEATKPWQFDIETKTWIDKVVIRIEPQNVRRFSIANPASQGQPIVFTRSENEASWRAETTPEGRGAVRQAEIEAAIARLRQVWVQEFKMPIQRASNLAVLGLKPPQVEIELTYVDGDVEKTASFQIGNPVDGEENVHYFTSSEVPFLMTWASSLARSFEADVAQSWFDGAGPPANPDAPGNGETTPDPGKKGGGGDGKKD